MTICRVSVVRAADVHLEINALTPDARGALAAMAAPDDECGQWVAGVAAGVHPLPVVQLVAIVSENRLIAQCPHP